MSTRTTSLEKIIVLDFGSQYNQLITRRIREFGVFSELLHNEYCQIPFFSHFAWHLQ